jgi:hypothetical protein
MKRISLSGWPLDDRDQISILARRLATEHFDTQMAVLKFNLAADLGEPTSDAIYMQVFAALTRLSLVGSELRVAILSYRTTSRLPAVGGGSQ